MLACSFCKVVRPTRPTVNMANTIFALLRCNRCVRTTMSPELFPRDFEEPEPIPEQAQQAVLDVLKSGRLFRYQGTSVVAEAEERFATFTGAKYGLGVNSGGCALFIALKAAGLQ